MACKDSPRKGVSEPNDSSSLNQNQKITLRGTESYIFYSNEKLGAGATATVFLGRHKKTGEKYALKVFNPKLDSRPIQARSTELTLLRSITHENIVKYYGHEYEQSSGMSIVIMEFCSGLSLHNLIEQPENLNGLSESRVLVIMKNLKDAVEYLFNKNIIHRDIKPGNILRYGKNNKIT